MFVISFSKMNMRHYATDIASITREKLRLAQAPRNMRNTIIRMPQKPTDKSKEDLENSQYPRKVFSGIQPTGSLHLGNYLGAVKKWTALQNERQKVSYCIVDMHSITLPQSPEVLRENILQMAATMFGCGIDPELSTVFVQSSVKEHSELCWILSCLSTMARLGHLPQYKEKTRVMKDIPLGLFIYPVLQAADIMLYKATHVPVGEDQIQHIQLTQQLAKNFNTYYGNTFPICHAIIENKHAARIRSLRDPGKKMSKSDLDTRATINITDEPEVIVDKIKKAVTDFTSDITFDPAKRPGVSNLINIYSLVTGKTPQEVCQESKTLNTAQFKVRVADAVVEHFKPIRIKINKHLSKRLDLVHLLEKGSEKARIVAAETMHDVKQKIGLGGQFSPANRDFRPEMLKDKSTSEMPSTLNASSKEDSQTESAEIIKETMFKVAPPIELKNKEQSSIILSKEAKEAKKDTNKFSMALTSRPTLSDADAEAKKLIQEIKIVQS